MFSLFLKVCSQGNYGYNCTSKCDCSFGTCNPNATSQSGSCTCNSNYEGLTCAKRVDACGKNMPSSITT